MDPMFWATKLHFHLTGIEFYNFPYTFGYLFALGVYAQVGFISTQAIDVITSAQMCARLCLLGVEGG
jgi:hypothetical protein